MGRLNATPSLATRANVVIVNKADNFAICDTWTNQARFRPFFPGVCNEVDTGRADEAM
jgi:hypothetical protein